VRILQLATYPIKEPLHGGQIRVAEIKRVLEQAGHEVINIAISEETHSQYSDTDLLVSSEVLGQFVELPFCGDLATSNYSTSDTVISHITQVVGADSVGVVFIEQPWLWPSVKYLCDHNPAFSGCKFVYSSQNIEYKSKELLLENRKLSRNSVQKVVDEIENLEIELCRSADLVVACTDIDALEFESMGASNVVVCPNGVRAMNPATDTVRMIQEVIGGEARYALFVGSAYPPNADGFWSMLGDSLAWMKPNEHIICVGGVSDILADFAPAAAEKNEYINFDRIKRLGFISTGVLDALLDQASVIICPITYGGGSNLKTAEAISSCRPVVATEAACRGFDFVGDLSDFDVCSAESEFRESMKKFLRGRQDYGSVPKYGLTESSLRTKVQWSYTLAQLSDVYSLLCA